MVRSHSLPADGPGAVRWGILSTARINDKLLAGARAAHGAHVLAVAGRDPERTRAYAAERMIERVHRSYEELLADPDIDAVYISLPNALHVEWTLRALAAGKHVLCEKPLSGSRADAAAAFDEAERQGRLLMEAFMYRHHPQTRLVQALVAEGAIGRLRLIRGQFSFCLTDSANVRLSRALAGGALMDVGCYPLSAARMLAGEPERVAAEQVLGGDGVDVVFAATLRFPGEVIAHLDCGLALAARHELEIVGEEGVMVLADPWHGRAPGIELTREGRSERGGRRRGRSVSAGGGEPVRGHSR